MQPKRVEPSTAGDTQLEVDPETSDSVRPEVQQQMQTDEGKSRSSPPQSPDPELRSDAASLTSRPVVHGLTWPVWVLNVSQQRFHTAGKYMLDISSDIGVNVYVKRYRSHFESCGLAGEACLGLQTIMHLMLLHANQTLAGMCTVHNCLVVTCNP